MKKWCQGQFLQANKRVRLHYSNEYWSLTLLFAPLSLTPFFQNVAIAFRSSAKTLFDCVWRSVLMNLVKAPPWPV